MSLDIIKEEIERRKKEIEDIKRMIRVMEKAGESTADLKARLIQAENLIIRWERALQEES
jgi:hypothetical protein